MPQWSTTVPAYYNPDDFTTQFVVHLRPDLAHPDPLERLEHYRTASLSSILTYHSWRTDRNQPWEWMTLKDFNSALQNQDATPEGCNLVKQSDLVAIRRDVSIANSAIDKALALIKKIT